MLPGTRATVADLAWLRDAGSRRALRARAAAGRPVLGICGGYQMLGREIDDDVESGAGVVRGLGLLPATVRFGAGEGARPPRGTAYGDDGRGRTRSTTAWSTAEGGEPFLDGCAVGAVWGTTWHGAFENDGFRRAFLREVAAEAGRRFVPADDVSFADVRERRLDALGDLVADHLDTAALDRLLEHGAPAGLPFVPPGAPGGAQL